MELKDGTLIAPLNVFDVLEAVEDYLGTEARQYLEDYFTDENPWGDLPKGDKVSLLMEHYQSVLDGIEDRTIEADRLMHKNPVQRKRVIEDLETIQKMISRERENYGKASV